MGIDGGFALCGGLRQPSAELLRSVGLAEGFACCGLASFNLWFVAFLGTSPSAARMFENILRKRTETRECKAG